MARRPRREAPPIGAGAILLRTLICLALFWAAFLALATQPAQWAFAQVALGIAWAAEGLLSLLGHELTREGIVLRDAETGAAIAVTAACDGHGLMAALAAALPACLMPALGLRRLVAFLVAAFVAVELFNLLRVVVLYLIGPEDAAAFANAHYLAFPLASAALLALIAAPLLPAHLRGGAAARVLFAAVATAALGFAWLLWRTEIAREVLLPVAEIWTGLFAPEAFRGFATEDGRVLIATHLVTGRDPTRYLSLPVEPADFGLALPLCLGAALLVLRRPAAFVASLLLALALTGLALAVAAVTMLHDAAATTGLTDLLLPEAGLYLVPRSYEPPGTAAIWLLKTAQNAIVHFNLFVLPFLAPVAFSGAGRRAWGSALART